MKARDYRDYLHDILDAVNDIESFTIGQTYDEFVKDRKTLNAVIRSIEIIGEASKNIPDPIKRKHKELPWKQMAGMRDKLIHAYFGVDTETLWKASKNNIPQLKTPIQKILKEQENATT
jgi:uncharacterized protein with HEPN domain